MSNKNGAKKNATKKGANKKSNPKEHRPFYKKVWFWVVIALAVVLELVLLIRAIMSLVSTIMDFLIDIGRLFDV